MGDLANMTECDGMVSGPRLLRWLRSRAEMAHAEERRYASMGAERMAVFHGSRAELLEEMAADLAAELTPPDYPEDDDDAVNLGDRGTGPCDCCGRLADCVPVRDNGRVWFACPACAARTEDDTVDLDDPALTSGPE